MRRSELAEPLEAASKLDRGRSRQAASRRAPNAPTDPPCIHGGAHILNLERPVRNARPGGRRHGPEPSSLLKALRTPRPVGPGRPRLPGISASAACDLLSAGCGDGPGGLWTSWIAAPGGNHARGEDQAASRTGPGIFFLQGRSPTVAAQACVMRVTELSAVERRQDRRQDRERPQPVPGLRSSAGSARWAQRRDVSRYCLVVSRRASPTVAA